MSKSASVKDEPVRILERLAKYDEDKDRKHSAASFRSRAEGAEEHADCLRELLISLNQ